MEGHHGDPLTWQQGGGSEEDRVETWRAGTVGVQGPTGGTEPGAGKKCRHGHERPEGEKRSGRGRYTLPPPEEHGPEPP